MSFGRGIDNFSNTASHRPACYVYQYPERYAYLSVTDAFPSGKVIVDTESLDFKATSRDT